MIHKNPNSKDILDLVEMIEHTTDRGTALGYVMRELADALYSFKNLAGMALVNESLEARKNGVKS